VGAFQQLLFHPMTHDEIALGRKKPGPVHVLQNGA
jgi:hypothetical protein